MLSLTFGLASYDIPWSRPEEETTPLILTALCEVLWDKNRFLRILAIVHYYDEGFSSEGLLLGFSLFIWLSCISP